MELTNDTKQQHFVSRAEQSLNASNPAASAENQRIFSFSLTDRDKCAVLLDDEHGRSIASNLVLYDLFSFDVKNKHATRKNFEALFGQYEAGIRENTESLIGKLASPGSDVKGEILGIFATKLLSFLRNPYSVKKVLATLGGLRGYRPTEADQLGEYNAIIAGKKPQQEYLCSNLEVSPVEYQAWLSALFMLLIRPKDGGPNLLEGVVKALYENPSHLVTVRVDQYTGEHSDKRCLLSDRGYCNPLPQSPHLAFGFNLCSHAFISYVFTDVDKAAPKNIDSQMVEAFKRSPRTVTVFHLKNDLAALSNYNRNVVFQCQSKVYSSSRTVYGIEGLSVSSDEDSPSGKEMKKAEAIMSRYRNTLSALAKRP